MEPKIPTAVVLIVVVVSTLYLLSAMALLSAGVCWLSLQFTLTIAVPLGFAVGFLSLVAAIAAIVMEGGTRLSKCLGFTFLTLTVVLILVSIGLLAPFVVLYNGANESVIGEYCEDCDQFGRKTQTCVDNCYDECCFTDLSEPLAIVLIAGGGLSLVTSVVGLGGAIAHLFYSFKLPSHPHKSL